MRLCIREQQFKSQKVNPYNAKTKQKKKKVNRLRVSKTRIQDAGIPPLASFL